MDIFSSIFFKILSALLSVLIGFLAGRIAKVERDSISTLLFYFISPIVFFAAPASTTLSLSSISIVLLTFSISSVLCIASYKVFSLYWTDSTKNILALSAGTANGGYFTLPIAAAVFDDYTLGVYVLSVVGIGLYESTVGFYICSSDTSSIKDNIKRVLKMPMLNAFVLGCIISISGFTLPDFLDDFIYNMRGAYSILGMMMIGLGVSTLEKFEIDINFIICALLSKFLVFPVAINLFILLDKFIFHWYTHNCYLALQLLSTAPMAGNVIVMSSLLRINVERSAAAVLVSSIIASIYMPLMLSLYLPHQ